ncbi:GH3 auxin-responsive promoter family protein [Weeksellaceae bacterium KMM 9713]|uniref:GH3 auxin-responsive promoter family protein n=1 Tax=Profundicola chukchiensis TaxID=2961959 RepID=A0A9X4MYV6_9FLAO|nr:GH3 auxin-responsive promoter family protein [Profundicola chukchiensis]MDG4945230.1 GH3 auxin-responsive promoter family protein [Profundicola chukchiensis]
MKTILAKLLSKFISKQEQAWITNAVKEQEKLLLNLVSTAKNTKFGKDHNFETINSHQDYTKAVSIQDYEDLKPYIDQVREGNKDILWPKTPKYFAKTSGTTSGAKYIPISKDSLPYHIKAARNALLRYIMNSNNADFVNGKMIFLQGSPVLEEENGIKMGRLSGIVAHYVPSYLQKNRMPSWETNSIPQWEEKVDAIVEETMTENLTLISGIPPWILMYFEKLQERTGKKIGEIFPNLQLIVTGGVNYEPYREKMNQYLGKKVDVIQTYPASEGFIAYQDQLGKEDLLLLLNHGIFYEFVPVEEFGKPDAKRLSIGEVELDTNYAVILTTNAGLWSYSIGDTVKFTSLDPYRIVVTGRIKHYTSAFGEHVIAQEVENALKNTLEKYKAMVSEFHIAPQVNPVSGLPYHEWFIEFKEEPEDLERFKNELDQQVQNQNPYYFDLIDGKVLRPLEISFIQDNGFNLYMKSQGKLGGQFKLPRLANDRNIADGLQPYIK